MSLSKLCTIVAPVALVLALLAAEPARAEVPLIMGLSYLEGRPSVDSPISPLGPGHAPDRLYGLWEVSICMKPSFGVSHMWMHYRKVNGGEVHTMSCFRRGLPGIREPGTDRWLVPPVEETGMHWDYDLRYEKDVQAGRYVLDRALVLDPIIYRKDDFTHDVVRNNCTTHVRDAWHSYTGRWYDLAPLHLPRLLAYDVANLRPDRWDARPAIQVQGHLVLLTPRQEMQNVAVRDRGRRHY